MLPDKLHIAIFGYSILSDYYNGSVSYFRGIIKELHLRGHQVTFFEPETDDRLLQQDLYTPEWVTVVRYKPVAEEADKMLLKASDAEIIIKAGSIGLLDEYLEENILRLKGAGKLVLFWDVNVAETLASLSINLKDPILPLLPHYDLVVTAGGGPEVIAAYKQLGVQDCINIPPAADQKVHFLALSETDKPYELVFVGNRWGDRESKVDDFFMDVAALLPDRKFLLVGSGWRDKVLPSNVTCKGYVNPAGLRNCYGSAKAAINISRESMQAYSCLPSKRIFEAAAAGCCLISDEWEGMPFFLEPGKEVLIARDGEEVLQHLSQLSPAKASQIGKAAQQKVMTYHTYAQRTDYFEKILSLHRTAVPG